LKTVGAGSEAKGAVGDSDKLVEVEAMLTELTELQLTEQKAIVAMAKL
jgi:hypothetical protein